MDRRKQSFCFIETINVIMIVKTHFKKYSCNEFYNSLLKETRLLGSISSVGTHKQQKKKFTHQHQNKIVFVYKYYEYLK